MQVGILRFEHFMFFLKRKLIKLQYYLRREKDLGEAIFIYIVRHILFFFHLCGGGEENPNLFLLISFRFSQPILTYFIIECFYCMVEFVMASMSSRFLFIHNSLANWAWLRAKSPLWFYFYKIKALQQAQNRHISCPFSSHFAVNCLKIFSLCSLSPTCLAGLLWQKQEAEVLDVCHFELYI